jgi:glycosyltransferase involved in cell wall biosynthesis
MRIGIDARKIADFGIGTYIRGLLSGLLELDTNDQYVVFAPADAPIPRGVEHVTIDAPHYSIRELLILGRAANRANLDLFHAPHYVVPFTRVPLVVTIHDLIHLHQPLRNPLAKIYAQTMLRRAVKKAKVVLTVSNAVQAQLENELGATNVIVTPNGVSVPVSSPANQQPPPANSFAYVGNDKPHKNVDALIDAFALVREQLPDARLMLVGASFERFRDRAGVDARGFIDDAALAAVYRDALALVMPSLEEGFGLPALEAMSHGAAVITSRDAALMEITGDAALHVDARDVRMLADAMLRIARDGDLRAQLGAKGVDRARDFTWRRCAERTRQAYQTVEHRGTTAENYDFDKQKLDNID